MEAKDLMVRQKAVTGPRCTVMVAGIFLGLLTGLGLCAGEAASPAKAPSVTDGKTPADVAKTSEGGKGDKDLDKEKDKEKVKDPKKDIDPKKFVFLHQDRRDPLCYAKVQMKKIGGPGVIGAPLTPQDIQIKIQQAEAKYAAAVVFFMAVNAEETINTCDLGIKIFEKVPDIFKYKDLVEVRERLMDLRRAGERVRSREVAKADFEKINPKLTGIVSHGDSYKKSKAVIEGQSVAKGSVVKTNVKDVLLMVEEIRPDQVIFLFKGYKMSQEFIK